MVLDTDRVTHHGRKHLAGGLFVLLFVLSGCITTRAPEPAPAAEAITVPSVAVLAAQIPAPEPDTTVDPLPLASLPPDTLALDPRERGAFLQDLRAQLVGSGRASYYGRRFAGRRTASGERFDPGALTAAHRTLPFGSRVRVTNLDNDRSVVVRINDRGPFAHRRVIDLSYAAADTIGMIRSGTAPVRIELLPTESDVVPPDTTHAR